MLSFLLRTILGFEFACCIHFATHCLKICDALQPSFHSSLWQRKDELNLRKVGFAILHGHTRRDFFTNAAITTPTVLFPPADVASVIDRKENHVLTPLVDLHMKRLKLPQGALGREYIIIPFIIQNHGPFYFMVDSGLTTEMITPHLIKILGMQSGGSTVRGLGVGGAKKNPIVELKDYSLWKDEEGKSDVKFPLPSLHAIVTDFPQEHIDPNYDVEGMIGMELLELFDVDFDFPKERIRFWSPQQSNKEGLIPIPAAVLNESGLEGIRVISPTQKINQPMLGIIDSGSSFSVVNLAAADLLGLPRDPKQYKTPFVQGIGVDGKPLLMPTASVQFSFTGNAMKDPNTGAIRFEAPPEM